MCVCVQDVASSGIDVLHRVTGCVLNDAVDDSMSASMSVVSSPSDVLMLHAAHRY